ncbi:DEAD/DEAH box helicase [Lentisphaerota bacterium WC36G]|nr:DEAD/DEAH box helicase [Lentisphaerae bacterium WC36]
MKLRPYQQQAMENVLAEWENVDRTLLVLPTGTGKTIVFAKTTEIIVGQRNARVLILAHRGELLEQASDKILTATGLKCATEKAEETALGSFFRITVGSVQTLMREKRLKQFAKDYYTHIIIDEAHHALSTSYTNILDYFSSAKVLGVTATPDRGDKKDLGAVFDSLAYEYALPQAIKDGYLCKIKALTLPVNIDLNGIGTQAGDFKSAELDDRLTPYLKDIAKQMTEHCLNRKTVIFLPLIATSQKMCEILNGLGFNAAEVNGNSPDRKQILEDFDAGKYNVLCNSMLLTEGWDCPSVDCIVCLRPTKVRSLYAQIIGRGTRLYPGKSEVLLLDFLWNIDRHELCRPAHLIAENREVAQKMTEKIEEATVIPLDLEFVEEDAKNEVAIERENKLADQLAEMKKRKRQSVDILQYEMSIQAEDLMDYTPAFNHEMAPASQKQKTMLEKFGIFPDDVPNAGKASLLIERLQKRQLAGMTTPKQIRFLEKKGFNHVGNWQFNDANNLIRRISANNWRIPNTIDPKTYNPNEGV